ncbi:MAG: protein kinase [Dehalococcoidia bacterium]|nr:MAG: protein kinase [Dehalococcoidia bacterium]
MRSINEIEQGFRTFAFKLQRLYQFGVELDSLNTEGFEKEVQSIRAKLKQPKAVAQVAEEIDALKKRIQARETNSRKERVEAREIDTMATVAAPSKSAEAQPLTRELGGELSEKYEVMDLIGFGGFADVYKARRKEDGQIVAVKIPRLAQFETVEPGAFLQEAQLWSRLSHPNIVKVFEYGTKPYPWIAVEYMEKGSLRSRIGQITLEECLEVALQICDALYYTHHLGVIHRDIKPENILCDSENNPKLSDWGLGKMMIELSMKSGSTGTPYYSSPEQVSPAKFGEVGWWTDIYQCGAVLYELVTGQLPFQGQSPLELALSITGSEVVKPSDIKPDLPAEFDSIIEQCLAKDKDMRYKDISIMRSALENVKSSLQ